MARDIQKSFLKTKWHVYKFLAELLINQGRIPEALQVMSMQKEEEFFDFLCRDAGNLNVRTTTATYTDEEQRWSERYQGISTHVAALGQELAKLRQKKKLTGLNNEEKKRYQQLDDEIKTSSRAFNNYLAKLIETMDGVSKRPIVAKELTMLLQLQHALRESGNGAVFIHYLITEDTLHIILTTTEGQMAYNVAITSRELSRKIMDFRITLQNPGRSPLSNAQELYKIAFAPLLKDLNQVGAKTLVFSLDGPLRYLPMAALHDGKHYLAELYPQAIYNAAAKLMIKDRPAERWRAGGLGLSKAVRGLDPLPNVPAELEGIVRQGPSDMDGILPGIIYLDESFTQEALESVLVEGFPVVHIASHFELVPGTIQNSHLVLGNGDTLSLATIKADGYDFGGVEMITLSACNTAVGGVAADGSEVEGFSALVQVQGAKGVLATMWPVVDQSTSILMQNFYRLREEKPGITKAEALSRAQLLFIQGETQIEEKQSDTQGKEKVPQKKTSGEERSVPDSHVTYAHPYYWSPFILMGNWL